MANKYTLPDELWKPNPAPGAITYDFTKRTLVVKISNDDFPRDKFKFEIPPSITLAEAKRIRRTGTKRGTNTYIKIFAK